MLKKIIIFDLDGTIADISHRLSLIEGDKKDFNKFYLACESDVVISPVYHLYKILATTMFNMVILTGRGEIARKLTEQWLERNRIGCDCLKMRPENNYDPAHRLKEKMFNELKVAPSDVFCAFDDDKIVVDMWNSKGIFCFQVPKLEK